MKRKGLSKGLVGFGGTAEPLVGEFGFGLAFVFWFASAPSGGGNMNGLKRKGFAAAAFGFAPGDPGAPAPNIAASAEYGSPAPGGVALVGVDRVESFDPVVACVEDDVVLVGEGGACDGVWA